MNISFAPLEIKHLSLLLKWLEEPHVKSWWDPTTKWNEENVAQKYALYMQGYSLVDGKRIPIKAYIIEMGGLPIGYIQYYNKYDFPNHLSMTENYDLSGLPKNLAGMDFYIGEIDYVGKGYAAKIVRQFLTDYVEKEYESCVVDPDHNNKVAMRIYDKVGFHSFRQVNNNITLLLWTKPKTDNPIVIFGSSRNKGDTWEAVQMVLGKRKIDIINLNDKSFSSFDYDYNNKEDDFLPLAKQMLSHNPIILATPVYWYSMSDVMKRFMDRWSDLLCHHKELGRKLRGKTLYVVSSYGVHPEGKNGFEAIFKQTAEYMGMHYGGAFLKYSGSRAPEATLSNSKRAQELSNKIFIQEED